MPQVHVHHFAGSLPGKLASALVYPVEATCAYAPLLLRAQICGLALLGVGVWLEIVDQVIVEAVQNSVFLVGPYLLIAVGAAIVVVAVLGIVGGACQKKFNRVLLILVRLAC